MHALIASYANDAAPIAGWLYVMQDDDMTRVKIGRSSEPPKRLAQGTTWNPELVIIAQFACEDAVDAERQVHARLAEHRVVLHAKRFRALSSGGSAEGSSTQRGAQEWFDVDAEQALVTCARVVSAINLKFCAPK